MCLNLIATISYVIYFDFIYILKIFTSFVKLTNIFMYLSILKLQLLLFNCNRYQPILINKH
jgi:hypothetical protein